MRFMQDGAGSLGDRSTRSFLNHFLDEDQRIEYEMKLEEMEPKIYPVQRMDGGL